MLAMKKQGWLVAVSLLLGLNVFAQSSICISNDDFGQPAVIFLDSQVYPMNKLEAEKLQIHYFCSFAFTENNEKEKMPKQLSGHYCLQIGNSVTKFQTETRFKADSVIVNGGSRPKSAEYFSQKANFVFAHDCFYRKGSSLTFTGRLAADDFMYKETIPPIKWCIRDSVKTICGYTCRFAEGTFRGRNYQAWFAIDIPMSAGPWKLNGLPGAILEAHDSLGQVSFVAEKVVEGVTAIYQPEYPYITVSRKQYSRLLEQLWKDSALFQANHTSRSSVNTILKEDRIVKPLPGIVILETEE